MAVVGVGTTGSHAARQLTQLALASLVIDDDDRRREARVAKAVATTLGRDAIGRGLSDHRDHPDVVVLCTPAGTHHRLATIWLQRGAHVVSISDDPEEVAALLDLDAVARQHDRALVAGAGFAPGLSCVLARFAALDLDAVEVISVYTAGTGGPACARQHHRALKRPGRDWIDGEWVLRRGGSGRDLAWFPDPFGARDCYRGALASPLLLQRVFPEARRISARIAASRRDRLTIRLPMLRPPHRDGGPGGIRVEVRGRRADAVETRILGVMDHPSVAAGTMAAVAVAEVLDGRIGAGASGLADHDDPKRLLRELRRRGVRAAEFSGVPEIAGA
ncbi:MAG: Gfo/Idh/MocA family oxidoreductase [Actinomycetota bacterium]